MRSGSSFYLNERDEALALNDEIDVAVAVPEAALNDAPAPASEPPFGDTLPQLAQSLLDRCHGAILLAVSRATITKKKRVGSFYCGWRVRT